VYKKIKKYNRQLIVKFLIVIEIGKTHHENRPSATFSNGGFFYFLVEESVRRSPRDSTSLRMRFSM
jgi:hypothetical protein